MGRVDRHEVAFIGRHKHGEGGDRGTDESKIATGQDDWFLRAMVEGGEGQKQQSLGFRASQPGMRFHTRSFGIDKQFWYLWYSIFVVLFLARNS